MNCVIENRRAEEFSPKGAFAYLMSGPKSPKVTGERLAIICESSSEPNESDDEKPEIHIRQFFVPFSPPQQFPIPYGNMPQNPNMGPLTHMPLRMGPPPQQQMPSEQGPPPMMPHPIFARIIAQAQAQQNQRVPQEFQVNCWKTKLSYCIMSNNFTLIATNSTTSNAGATDATAGWS